jgi:hypothetical protein
MSENLRLYIQWILYVQRAPGKDEHDPPAIECLARQDRFGDAGYPAGGRDWAEKILRETVG